MATAVKPQTSMDDKWIEDGELLAKLEDREEAKAGQTEFQKLDREAKAMILARGITAPVRCGRFIVGAAKVEGKTVESFETKESVRVSIKTADKSK
jgi:hypothetical protein